MKCISPDLEGFTAARTGAWIELLQSLIRQRSVFEHEDGIVDLVSRHLVDLGLSPVRVPHDAARLAELPGAQRPFSTLPGRASLVAHIPGTASGRSLIFNAHLDIVGEGDTSTWTRRPFGGEIDGDTIYGRGAMDDKAGVAIALALAETLRGAPVEGDVIFHFVLEDENAGNGSLLCLDSGHGGDAAVIIDGTRPDRAIDRHAGQFQFHLHVTGKPASVSVSHLGVNAADAVARLVARLADRVGMLNAERSDPWTRFPSPFQLVTQRLASEGGLLTVPEHADALCYVTFPPPWTVAMMRAFIEDEIQRFSAERGLRPAPVLTAAFNVEPVVSGAAALADVLIESAALENIGPIDVGPSTGTSDLRHFAAAGIPCLLYGPGNGFNPHRPDEHYRLSDLPVMVRLFARLADAWTRTSHVR
jgi:acetylornithine deacetylase